MQFKFVAIVTSLLAASSAQVAALSTDTSGSDDLATSLDNLAYRARGLTTTFKRLNKNTLPTKGFAAIAGATKLALTISVLDTTPAFDNSSDTTPQDAICEELDYLDESLAGLLDAINSKLSIIAGSGISASVQVVLGLLQAASDSLQAQILVVSPYCGSGSD